MIAGKDRTATPRFEERGEYHASSAATEAYDFPWQAERLWRWNPGAADQPSWTRHSPSVVMGHIVGFGVHDIIAFDILPETMRGIVFVAPGGSPSPGAWSLPLQSSLVWVTAFERRALGPSSPEGPIRTTTIQRVEDVVFGHEFVEWSRPALVEIERLAELEEGWDSYDASRIDLRTREEAIRFLRVLFSLGKAVPVPSVLPSPSGGVIFQWSLASAELNAEIAVDSLRYFLNSRDRLDRCDHSVFKAHQLGELAARIRSHLG